jgi:hypothetical protein
VLILAIAAGRLAEGHLLSDSDRDRLALGSRRLLTAAQESGHA